MPPETFVAVVGAGPAGLMAAQRLAERGVPVRLYESQATPGRKMLRAGKGGLNLTHGEPFERFVTRYGARSALLTPLLAAFGPAEVRAWAADLGVETLVGSSGRVFPVDLKAAPLLRAWMQRLATLGVRFHPHHRWQGWTPEGDLLFATPDGPQSCAPAATVLALGGASWPRLGSDGAWVAPLTARGLTVQPLRPANCGFDLDWSESFAARHAGSRLAPVTLSFAGISRRGELTLTASGIEGGLVYGFSAAWRDALAETGAACPVVDLLPDWPLSRVQAAVARPRGARSFSTFIRKALPPLGANAVALLREILPPESLTDPAALAAAVKHLPLALQRPRPLAEAISTAGGVDFADLDASLMVRNCPGLFLAGEMLDWEAPTGGYLLTGCFALGQAAGQAAAAWFVGLPPEPGRGDAPDPL